jgi:hypothetical protein
VVSAAASACGSPLAHVVDVDAVDDHARCGRHPPDLREVDLADQIRGDPREVEAPATQEVGQVDPGLRDPVALRAPPVGVAQVHLDAEVAQLRRVAALVPAGVAEERDAMALADEQLHDPAQAPGARVLVVRRQGRVDDEDRARTCRVSGG